MKRNRLDYTTFYCATRMLAWLYRYEGSEFRSLPTEERDEYLAGRISRALGIRITESNVIAMFKALHAAYERSVGKV